MNYIQNILKLRHRKNNKLSNALEPILGFKPKKIHYYERAFTHRSTNKKDEIGNPFNYERLEYVGDAILGAVVAHYLYVSILDANEGYLTKMRSKIVSRSHLNEIGKGLHLISLLDSKLENSKSEIRRLLRGNAIKINDKLVNDDKMIIDNELFNDNYLKLSIGKKRHIKIELD